MGLLPRKSAVPELPETRSAFEELLKVILEEIAAFKARFPEETAGFWDKVQSIVVERVQGFSAESLKAAFISDVMNLVKSGKGPAPHDPTELA